VCGYNVGEWVHSIRPEKDICKECSVLRFSIEIEIYETPGERKEATRKTATENREEKKTKGRNVGDVSITQCAG